MKFTDPKKLQAHLDKRATTIAKKNVKKVVTRGIMIIDGTAKKSIQAGGSGQSVKRYNPIREHVTSAPNNPPATDTGFLVSQITTNISSKPDGSVVGQLISSAPYSKALEYGTVNMQPRPFMHPAFQKNKNKILKMFKEQGIIK
tara:strand:- start:222 stop:653 length:432 start_codon:yes stop_codon:yes gene_type:complete